jgi:hypothetical protein
LPSSRAGSPERRSRLEVVEQSLAPDQSLMLFVMDCLENEGFLVSSVDWPLLYVELAGSRVALGVGGHPRRVRELSDLLSRCQDLVRVFS